MTQPFRPVIYLKDRCPWCLKLRLFLLEARLLDAVELRGFVPGEAEEAAIREELAPHFEKPTFPTAQLAPGEFLNDSAAIIAHFAARAGVDLAALPVLDQYVRGPLARLGELREEIAELKARG